MIVRKYSLNDIKQMIDIWNEVVEEGIAFPQEDPLSKETGEVFSHHKDIAELQLITAVLWSDYIFFTLITSEDAGIYAMPAMRCHPYAGDITSAKSSSQTA